MNHNKTGQFTPPLQPPMSSALGSTAPSSGEILDALDALGSTIARCEFIAQELMGRLGPVLASPNVSEVGGIAPDVQLDTQLGRLVQEHTNRVRALLFSIEDASKRLALP